MFEGDAVVENMRAQQAAAEVRRREGLIRRLGEFLKKESGGDEDHPAALVRKALEAGSDQEAIAYLSAQIDETETDKKDAMDEDAFQKAELRRGDLMRWKTNLTGR